MVGLLFGAKLAKILMPAKHLPGYCERSFVGLVNVYFSCGPKLSRFTFDILMVADNQSFKVFVFYFLVILKTWMTARLCYLGYLCTGKNLNI